MLTDINSINTQKYLRQGLYLDALRGMDSTGLCTVDKYGDILINKKAMPSGDFLQLKSVDEQIDDTFNRVFIGHNRAATRGVVNNVNSHPFQHDHITMVHNGSLRRMDNLPDHSDFTVDSDAIAHSLAKIGTEETLKLLDGAFALVWYDEETQKVHMVRNSERPLTIASIKDKNTIIWGSESRMVEYIAGRVGLPISEIWDVPTATLLTYDYTSKDISDCEMEEVTLYKETKYDWYEGYSRNDAGFRQPIKYGGDSFKERAEEAEKEVKAREEKAGKKVEVNRKKRDLESQRLFKEVGLVKGQKIEVWLYDFKPYSPSYPNSGTWEGCTADDPYLTVRIHGAGKGGIDTTIPYMGDALCMRIEDAHYTSVPIIGTTLILSNGSLVPTSEWEKEVESEKKSLPFIPDMDTEEDGMDGTDFLYLTGPRGIAINRAEWDRLTKHGCGVCSRDIEPLESGDIEWWGQGGEKSPVCHECMDDMVSGVYVH